MKKKSSKWQTNIYVHHRTFLKFSLKKQKRFSHNNMGVQLAVLKLLLAFLCLAVTLDKKHHELSSVFYITK